MTFDNRDSIDFGKTKISKLFKSIFVPTLMGMLFNVAFTLTDGIFVGNGIGPEGLACINLACPIMLIITGFGMLFGVGSSVVAAIHLSRQNVKAARINVTQAFLVSSILALLMMIFLYAFPKSIYRLLGVSDNLMLLESQYYLWFIPTCIFLMFQIVGEFIIRLDGSPIYAMMANIIPAVVNIILDYVFIFPCGMGLKGAALATDIGTGVGLLMTLYYMIFKAKDLQFYRLKCSMTSLRLTLRNTGYMFKVGFSAFVGELAISVMILTGNISFGKYLGDSGIAAYSVICYLFPVVYMVYSAVATSAQPIISFNYGAEQKERVGQTFRFSVGLSIVFGLLITLIFCFFSESIISIFLERGSNTFVLAAKGLPLYASGFVFVAFNVSAIGYFQSVEKTFDATVLMLLRGVVLLIAAFILCPLGWGDAGLWLAVPVAEFITAIVSIICLIISSKKSLVSKL